MWKRFNLGDYLTVFQLSNDREICSNFQYFVHQFTLSLLNQFRLKYVSFDNTLKTRRIAMVFSQHCNTYKERNYAELCKNVETITSINIKTFIFLQFILLLFQSFFSPILDVTLMSREEMPSAKLISTNFDQICTDYIRTNTQKFGNLR